MSELAHITFDDPSVFITMMEGLSNLLDEVAFVFYPDKKTAVCIKEMDTSHICSVGIWIAIADCTECTFKAETIITIKLPDLVKALKRGKKDTQLKLSIENNRFQVEFLFTNKKQSKKYILNTIDRTLVELDYDALHTMIEEYKTHFTFPNAELKNVCDDGEIITEVMQISADTNQIRFHNLTINGEFESSYEKEELIDPKLTKLEGNFFAITYLKTLHKVYPSNANITIYLNQDQPFFIRGKLGDGSVIEGFLAPRVEEDGDTYDE
jgi:proliferating cell nuclear antigen PCNA